VGVITYDDDAFRALFPAYSPVTTQYLPAKIQAYWDAATAYVGDRTGGCYTGGMSVKQQTLALNLMTAHLLALSALIASGNTPGVMTGATIDKISVTLAPPPAKNQWQYWLQTTLYGQQLLSLLQVASVGGFYASSAVPGRAGFQFGNGW
jgi:ABC-type dipeptide/oligopeptide/nickel transport system permease subunit